MIKLDHVVATYTTQRGRVAAVDDVSLEIPAASILGIAGESGCGKSTLMKVIYGDLGFPLDLASGSVDYGYNNDRGEPVTSKNIQKEWFQRISYIPQSSMSSLNPVVRIKHQFTDYPATSKHKQQTLAKARAFIQKVGLPAESLDAYPHQLSGGMRQRIMVALATFQQPEIILADEPTTALDVVVQKEILLLLLTLQREMHNTIVFVSHDMGVHYQLTDRMMIMYAAKTVEYGPTADIFARPLHPYTLMLTNSLPAIGDDRARAGLPGSPPSLWEPPAGCRFAPRCPLATELCRTVEPGLIEHQPGRFSACHFADSVPQLRESSRQAPKLSDVALTDVESALRLDAALETAPKVEEPVR